MKENNLALPELPETERKKGKVQVWKAIELIEITDGKFSWS